MVESSTPNYETLQAELIAYADKMLGNPEQIKLQLDEPDTERKVYFEMKGDDPIMMQFVTAEDVALDDVKAWFADFAKNMARLSPPAASFNVIEQTGCGRTLAHHKMSPPVPLVSARSFLVTYYTINVSDDEFIFMLSSQGNDDIAQTKYKHIVNKDVIGEISINYFNWKVYTDDSGEPAGVKVKQVNVGKPKGSLPNMIVSKIGKVGQQLLPNIIRDLKGQDVQVPSLK